jgi:S1-C subfamily serine protease
MKFRWIAGWVGVCLVSAIAAAGLTAAMLLKGVFGFGPLVTSPPSTSATSQATVPSQTNNPQSTPTMQPTPTPPRTPTGTPSPTISPSPMPTAAPSPTPEMDPYIMSAIEQYYLWQTRDLLENIYSSVSLSVVGIKIEVGSSDAVKMTNEGSGILFDEKGNIMTNAGLLSIAVDKQGKLVSGALINVYIQGIYKSFTATIVGRDMMTGLVVLHINPGAFRMHPAKFATDITLKVGQTVLAIGYPEQLYAAGCMTSGIISGLNYPVMLENGATIQMIQTNTPISSACSGGALLNLTGEVIGLTNGSLSTDLTDRMSYALSGPEALKICQNLVEKGYVSGRSWLGVTVLSAKSFLDLQKLYSLPAGLFISSIIEDSPAASVDLRKGDVITQINDTPVDVSMDIGQYVQSQPVGSLVVIRVYRRADRLYHEYEVYLEEYGD